MSMLTPRTPVTARSSRRTGQIVTLPTVLVVEDQLLLRLLAADVIEEAGYPVLMAEDADEALSMMEQRSDIRLVFSDIEMPGAMDGLAFAHCISRRWPPVGIVLTSGVRRIEADHLPEGGIFLRKPFLPNEVSAALDTLVH